MESNKEKHHYSERYAPTVRSLQSDVSESVNKEMLKSVAGNHVQHDNFVEFGVEEK